MTNKFYCIGCDGNTLDMNEYYMVSDAIWDCVDGGEHMLCIGCLEDRLGRRLTCVDFPDLPVNTIHKSRRSSRLQDRLRSNE